MKIHKLVSLFVPILVGAVVFVPVTASATNGGQFTSLSADYVELGIDDDGHSDDLVVTFTETGTGNSKLSDITVTATREATATCVAPGRTISRFTSDPLSVRLTEGESPSDASAQFTTDENGLLTGTVFIRTTLQSEVCPFDPDHAYVVTDYSLVYTNVTVTDNENEASAAIERADPGYNWSGATVTTPDLFVAGLSCTIESAEDGHCETY